MKGVQDNEKIMKSGYADSKADYEEIKRYWKTTIPGCRIIRGRTDTKGLIMYSVVVKT